MIRDEKRLRQMRQELLQTAKTLGDPGASKRAAKVALSLLSDN
jgi:hypothetical protein